MRILLVNLLLSFVSVLTYSQDTLTLGKTSNKIKIYLDCDDCDFSFFRRNLKFVDFVRDPKLAEIHILVTEQETAGDGTEYGINFLGSGNFADLHYKLKTISPQSETDILKWERLLKILEIGLLPYLSNSPEMDMVKIDFDDKTKDEATTKDQWRHWVFSIESGFEFEAEESQKEYSFSNAINSERITDILKFKSELAYEVNKEFYVDDEEEIESKKEEAEFNIDLVYSLNPRWSVGLFGELLTSSYLNLNIASEIGPAIEYNIFPWDKSDRKVFAIAYHFKTNYFNYRELTLFDKNNEWRNSESLKLTLLLRQPWGKVENTLEGSHYFFDFSKNRLSLESDISINVTKGLSFFIELEAELLHDQLYLPSGEASRDEILLKQRKLATAFEVSGVLGIRFTFGSRYNNIVNQRL